MPNFLASSECLASAERKSERRTDQQKFGQTENADVELGTRNERQAHLAGKALVLAHVVVLERNLELDGLKKLALLVLASLENRLD